MRKLLFYLFLSCASLQLSAQTAEEDSVAAIAHEQDSIIQSLRNKVEEMTMQQVMLLAELERTGRIARLDSMAQAERQHHIDSFCPYYYKPIRASDMLLLHYRDKS